MEATKEQHTAGLLEKIVPPRLEDAGLEDCALPPASIQEAFQKAASAVKSRAAALFHSDDEDEPGCVEDPWPINAEGASDTLVGVLPPCPEASDDVVVRGLPYPGIDGAGHCIGDEGDNVEVGDRLVVSGDCGEKDWKGCVDDGLEGLKISEKEKKKKREKETEVGGGGGKPTLVEGFAA